jgi:hypothetical protein
MLPLTGDELWAVTERLEAKPAPSKPRAAGGPLGSCRSTDLSLLQVVLGLCSSRSLLLGRFCLRGGAHRSHGAASYLPQAPCLRHKEQQDSRAEDPWCASLNIALVCRTHGGCWCAQSYSAQHKSFACDLIMFWAFSLEWLCRSVSQLDAFRTAAAPE